MTSATIITALITICIVLLYALVEQYAWRRLNERRAAAYRHRCDLLAERLSTCVRNETMLRYAIRAMQRECMPHPMAKRPPQRFPFSMN